MPSYSDFHKFLFMQSPISAKAFVCSVYTPVRSCRPDNLLMPQ